MQLWINMTKQKDRICPFRTEKMSIYGHALLTDVGVNCYVKVVHWVLTQLFCQNNALWAQELV